MDAGWLRRPLERQSAVILTCLSLLCVLAWLYLLTGAGMDAGSARDMPGMAMPPGLGVVLSFAIALAMWWIMMIAMMLPAAAPAILLYARVRDHVLAKQSGPIPADALVFAAGY